MTGFGDMDERFAAFVSSYQAGDGNPRPFMEGLDDGDRRRFRRRIEKYLEANPAPVADQSRFNDPKFLAMADQLADRLDAASGAMSQEVITLRTRKGLLQEEVVDSLSEEFASTEAEKEKIEDYYHDLEFGNLPVRKIKDELLDALGRILGTSREALRKAGEAMGPSGSPESGLIYARMADEDEFVLESAQMSPATPAPVGEARRSSPPDRIDELFTGG